MQLVANQQLVKNRVRLGLGFHITALIVFAVGLILSTQIDATRELPWESWVAIIGGLGVWYYRRRQNGVVSAAKPPYPYGGEFVQHDPPEVWNTSEEIAVPI